MYKILWEPIKLCSQPRSLIIFSVDKFSYHDNIGCLASGNILKFSPFLNKAMCVQWNLSLRDQRILATFCCVCIHYLLGSKFCLEFVMREVPKIKKNVFKLETQCTLLISSVYNKYIEESVLLSYTPGEGHIVLYSWMAYQEMSMQQSKTKKRPIVDAECSN